MSKKKKKQQRNKELLVIWGLVGVCVLGIFLMIKGFAWLNEDKTKNNVCSSCHKVFTNQEDVDSISWTSMCTPCYETYKFTEEIHEETKKRQERNQ